jgi:hypothetical protein
MTEKTDIDYIINNTNWANVHNDGKIELYNLKDDVSEENDVADKYPDKVAEMDSLMKVSRVDSELFQFK